MALLEVNHPEASRPVWTKQDLRAHLDELLAVGLTPEQLAAYRRCGLFDDALVLQSTSGSSGHPLVIPRSDDDMQDIGRRITRPHLEAWGRAPERVALLGGISHVQGALKMRLAGTDMRSFELADVDALAGFAPDYLSCYPSIARELIARHADRFPGVMTLKLGGERVLDVDVARARAAWPGAIIVEQLGSTEMPAVAIGVIGHDGVRRGLELQTERFSFRLDETSTDWQPLVVRDRFPNRLVPIDAFYDAGDEVRLVDGRIAAVRRRDDPANAVVPAVEALLAAGCINVQIDRSRRTVICDGAVPRPRIDIRGDEYQLVAGAMRRLPDSNKLPCLLD